VKAEADRTSPSGEHRGVLPATISYTKKETTMPSHATITVAGYLLRRLTDAGVRSVFGTRGGDSVLFRAITDHQELTWVETATEQAAGDAAGAYARLRGLGATLNVTRPPRAMATPAPVVHIMAASARTSHLTKQADLRPDTATAEIDRMLAIALRSGDPVSLVLSADVAVAPVPVPAGPLPGDGQNGEPLEEPLSWGSLWAAVQGFLAPDDVLVTDPGALDGAATLALPDGARLITTSYPAPAGWAGPAALGASLAAPDRRVVVLSGDRGPAWTAGLGALLAQGLAPVMIWAGEDGTLVPAPAEAIAAAAVTAEVTSLPELTAALRAAYFQAAAGRLVLIEAVLGRAGIPVRRHHAA
jgi:TPP-dependent 2-oxoacid decarboxylase